MLFPKPAPRPKRRRKDDRGVYRAVERRDGGCVAPRLDPMSGECGGPIQRDHVPEGYSRMGRRERTSVETVVLLCGRHHLGGWATGHRPLLREYLRRMSGE